MHMYYAFIDESESPHGSDEPELEPFGYGIFYVGCMLVDDHQLASINAGFERVRQRAHERFNIPEDAEFHGQCMFQYKDDWIGLKGKHRAAIGIYRSLMNEITASGGVLFVRGVHERQLKRRYGEHAHDPHSLALQYCLERVNFYAESEGIRNIQIVADKVSDPAAHEGMLKRYKLLGSTEGYVGSDLAHIDFPFRWEDSRKYFGLQAIDTALFILNRAVRLKRDDMSSKGDREVLKTAQILLPHLHRSSGISYLQNRKSYYLMPELYPGYQK